MAENLCDKQGTMLSWYSGESYSTGYYLFCKKWGWCCHTCLSLIYGVTYTYSSHRLVLVLEQSCFIAQLGKPRSFTNSDGHTGHHEAISNAMETNIYCENWGKIWPIACDSPNSPKFSTSKVLWKSQFFAKILDFHFFSPKLLPFLIVSERHILHPTTTSLATEWALYNIITLTLDVNTWTNLGHFLLKAGEHVHQGQHQPNVRTKIYRLQCGIEVAV